MLARITDMSQCPTLQHAIKNPKHNINLWNTDPAKAEAVTTEYRT